MRKAPRFPNHTNRNHQGSRMSGSYVPMMPGKTAHTVSALDVECPECKQPPRMKCVNAKGEVQSSHASRRRIAIRQDNARRENEGTLTAGSQRRPGKMEDPVNGLECPVCHLKIRVTLTGKIWAHTVHGDSTNGRGFTVKCQGTGTLGVSD